MRSDPIGKGDIPTLKEGQRLILFKENPSGQDIVADVVVMDTAYEDSRVVAYIKRFFRRPIGTEDEVGDIIYNNGDDLYTHR